MLVTLHKAENEVSTFNLQTLKVSYSGDVFRIALCESEKQRIAVSMVILPLV